MEFIVEQGFPGCSEHKESVCNAEDPGSIPGLRRSPREGNGYPLWYRQEWSEEPGGLHSVNGVVKSWTELSDFHFRQEKR